MQEMHKFGLLLQKIAWSVCLLVTTMSCVSTAEPKTEMPFGGMNSGGIKKPSISWGPGSPPGEISLNFRGERHLQACNGILKSGNIRRPVDILNFIR